MIGNKVVVIGGVGFVGRAVVNELSKSGYQVTVCVRRLERYREFALFPNTRLAHLPNMTEAALNAVMVGQDILINLTADMTAGTEALPVNELVAATQKMKQVAEHQGVQRIIQVSQIGADANQAKNEFLSVLGEANQIMHNAVAQVTILRPGLLIGEKDETTARFNAQLKRFPVVPVANGSRVVQPLSVKDFAVAVVKSIKDASMVGKKVDVVGEERLTLKELAALVRDIQGEEDAMIFPMCAMNAKLMSYFGRFAPVVSVSNAQMLNVSCDLISDADFSKQFGFEPQSLTATIARYVAPHYIRERYNDFRQDAGRHANELL